MVRSSIPRRPKFKALPKNKNPMPQGFYTNGHKHGCRLCDHLMACNCKTPEKDPLCAMCLYGRDRPFHPHASWPRDCCRYYSTLVQREQVNQYLLAGLERRWFVCGECKRHHAYDPSNTENDPPRTKAEWVERFGPLPEPPRTNAVEFTEYINERNRL